MEDHPALAPATASQASDPRPVVLVTGASSGIGRATAIEFARRRDAVLVLAARRTDELRTTARLADAARPTGAPAGRPTATCVACDLTDPEQLDLLVAQVHQIGRLDVLVNNAGAASSRELDDADPMPAVDRTIALNLRAPIALTHALTPLLRAAGGTVVNVSSVAGLVGTPGSDVYSATKWALTGFSEAARARLHADGIRVVCVQPGPVPTPGWPHERLASMPVLGRLLASDVDELARTCVRAAEGRGGPAPIRPRTYHAIPLLRAVAPWLLRRALAVAATRRRRTMRTDATAAEPPIDGSHR